MRRYVEVTMPLVAWVVTVPRYYIQSVPFHWADSVLQKRPPAQQRLPQRRQSCCRSGYCHLNSALGGPTLPNPTHHLIWCAWYTKIWVQSIGHPNWSSRDLSINRTIPSCVQALSTATTSWTFRPWHLMDWYFTSLVQSQLTKVVATCVKHLWACGFLARLLM